MILKTEKHLLNFSDPKLDGLEYHFWVGNSEGVYGQIRFELTPYLAVIHPRLFRCTKTTLAEFKNELYAIGVELLFNTYDYDKVYITTKKDSLVKALSNNTAILEKENIASGVNLYSFMRQ